jgi:hypothetical protein
LPSPDYDDLKAYLEHTVRGYQLVSNAFSSYVKGLEKGDAELVKEGDHDLGLGLKEINDASEELAQFLRSHSY